jgi:hypothetical protein
MDGSEKIPLLVVGKSARPRCFRNVQTLPTEYEANKKAWMTGDLFRKWIQNLDRSFTAQKHKIWMILDNCTAHPDVNLRSIKHSFLPPNTTSITQPMGIIYNLKALYRKQILLLHMDAMESNSVFTLKKQRKYLFLQELRPVKHA